jgi:signal transduction histidine kinase
MIRKSLQFKVIFAIASILVILLGGSFIITTTISINTLNKEFEETTRRKAVLLMETIYNNFARSVEAGHMKRMMDFISMIGGIQEVETLVIFDQNGIVLQSIHPEDKGKRVSDIHFDVYRDNEIKGRSYNVGKSKEFCLVRPLFNKKECTGCHDSSKRVLGVLDVCLSMASTQERIRENRRIMYSFGITAAVITIVVTSLCIALSLRFMVVKPVGTMVRAINQVEKGDLLSQVPVSTSDELGHMGRSFNQMVDTIRKLNELKDEFISIVSHELRTPLTSIKYFTEVMLERVGKMEAGKQAKYLKVINEETDRLTRLINDLLDLQKISAGKFKWKEEEIDMRKVIEGTVNTFSGGAASRSIRLSTHIKEDLPLIIGDKDKIIQLLANLLSNAIKFTKIGGHITVSASTGDNMDLLADKETYNRYILVSVKDEGIGITKENIGRIFEKFQQVEDSYTRSKGGTGLGLSISKEIVVHHGGRIWVESEVNEGSTFFFTLPYRQKDAIQPAGVDRDAKAATATGS